MSPHLIECIHLSKQYIRNKQTVIGLEDINLQINQNELVLLKGRSGAGKSTLLNLMSGLIKPTQGRVMIGSQCISEMPDSELSHILATRIGIIFQSFNLLPTFTVYENIEVALVPVIKRNSEVKEKIMSLLEQFNLSDKALVLPSELSVGQQQKAAIIRTLIKEPTILFADEPTGSVDDETAREILEQLMNLKREKGVTLVVATHGNILEKSADKVFLIENGRLK